MAEMLDTLEMFTNRVAQGRQNHCVFGNPPSLLEMIRQPMSLNKTSENDPKCTTKMYQIPITRRLFRKSADDT